MADAPDERPMKRPGPPPQPGAGQPPRQPPAGQPPRQAPAGQPPRRRQPPATPGRRPADPPPARRPASPPTQQPGRAPAKPPARRPPQQARGPPGSKQPAKGRGPRQPAKPPARAAPKKRKTRSKGRKRKGAKKIVHSKQLDERMRRGDAKATGADKAKRVLLDFSNVVAFGLMMVPVAGRLGYGPATTLEMQTLFVGLAAILMTGNSFLFTTIRWRAMRGAHGQRILDKAKTDLQLTIVSIVSVMMVVVIVLLEAGALMVFLGALEVAGTVDTISQNFVLFQVIILLVYLMALVIREIHLSTYDPKPAARTVSNIIGPMAVVVMTVGVLLALGLPQRIGLFPNVLPRQAVHVVMLGLAVEFLAMRIRMRLPSLTSLFSQALQTARRANPEVREALRRKARRTYVIALLFVVLTMLFAAAIATGAVRIEGTRATLSLVIFYTGTALIILGLVVLRLMQRRHLKETDVADADDLSRLVQQKRKSPEQILRAAVYMVGAGIGIVFLLVAVMTGLNSLPWHEKYSTDLFLLALLFAGGPYGWFYNKDRRRIEAMDEKFPDFLRDIAESARAGITLPKALIIAAHGTYGALTDDIRKMAAQVEWGVEFSDALLRFASRVKTPLIDRTVSLVIEAQRSGGNVVDVLTAASSDAREIKQIVSERSEQMKMYQVVVYIAFFVFIAVVLVLSAQFIPAFKEAVGGVEGQQVGGLQFKDFDPEDFNTLFFHAAIVQAIGGGLVGGVLTRGSPMAGFNSIVIMLALSWLSFRVILGLI